jgi:hypothetical protein
VRPQMKWGDGRVCSCLARGPAKENLARLSFVDFSP